jgi:DNA-binding NarL/FixJ family response regulator
MSDPIGAVKRARVFIVDDHPVVREGLSAKLSAQCDLEVCGEAEDVAGALALVESARPDVFVVDISLKHGDGIDLIKRIMARDESARVVVWSMHQEGLYAERALRAGALAYVHKGRATREILQAIRSALAGKVYLSEDFSAKLIGRLVGGQLPDRSPIETLSDRELEVFRSLGRGLTTEQIAEKMHLSPKTVETYRARIKQKLGLTNMSELIQRATAWLLENP